MYVMTFARPLVWNYQIAQVSSQKDTEILKTSEGSEMELSGTFKRRKAQGQPFKVNYPSPELCGELLHKWRKETVTVLKGREVQIDPVSWKL